MKKNILIFVSGYSESCNSGGPFTSISNLTKLIHDSANVYIISIVPGMDSVHLNGKFVNRWFPQNGVQQFYLTNLAGVIPLLRGLGQIPFDAAYANSFFDWKSICLLLLMKVTSFLGPAKLLLAPRGEFSIGALSLKPRKKYIYISLFRFLRLHKVFSFHATSSLEKTDILNIFPSINGGVHCIANIPSYLVDGCFRDHLRSLKSNNCFDSDLSICFISRISRKKNLHLVGDILANVDCSIFFDIYGPIEDIIYWRECIEEFSKIPSHVTWRYVGNLRPDEVPGVLSGYDLMLLPTAGENFGHVIAESLSTCTRVLISDQTPWVDLENFGVGWSLPLNDLSRFSRVLNLIASEKAQSIEPISCERFFSYLDHRFDLGQIRDDYLRMFIQ